MRARDFLLEYNRQITAQRFGDAVLRRAIMDQGRNVSVLIKDLSPEQKQFVIDSVLGQLEEADPTPNKQYMPWLAKMYGSNSYGTGIEDLKSTTRDALIKFHKLKTRRQLQPPRNDIMRYRNMDEFLDAMDTYEDPDDATREKDRGSAREVFRNEQVRIIVPENEAAACYYGQGTRWCTAAKNHNMFTNYARDGDLYILLPQKPDYQGEKYQIHIPSAQFMDEADREVSPYLLLTRRFGNLLPEFMSWEPELANWLMFTPDSVLEPVLEKIRQAVQDWAWERLSEWETGDDYYYEWLVDNGYVYPEGHEEAGQIDWERVGADRMDYVNWNEETRQWYRDLMGALEVDPARLKEDLQTADITWTFNDLPDVLADIVEGEFGRRLSGGAEEFLRRNIDVVPGQPGQPARVDLLWRDRQDRLQRREIQ